MTLIVETAAAAAAAAAAVVAGIAILASQKSLAERINNAGR
jgi:hypothetical protein